MAVLFDMCRNARDECFQAFKRSSRVSLFLAGHSEFFASQTRSRGVLPSSFAEDVDAPASTST